MIFEPHQLKSRSILQRLFKQHPEENAIISINNLLGSKPILSVNSDDIKYIAKFYNINLVEYNLNLEEFYAVLFNTLILKLYLSLEDKILLNHLAQILYLSEATISSLKIMIGESLYLKEYERAIRNGIFSEQDRATLDRLKIDTGLPDAIAKKVSDNVRSAYINKYFQNILKNKRVSPKEEEDLIRVTENLNVNLTMNEENQLLFNRYKLYWELENLDVPVIEADTPLQKNEVCHYIFKTVEWLEPRVQSSKYGTTYLKSIDEGRAYLTNKRLILIGDSKNFIIRLEDIVSARLEKDLASVFINKLTGRSPTLRLKQNADILSVLLKRLSYL